KFAPARKAGQSEFALSDAAWASGTFEAHRLPPQRSGTPSRRASCPIARYASAGSGVPKVGAPLRSDIDDRKLPRIGGEPGRSSWASATQKVASAKHCASAPAVVTGPMAPPRMKGTQTGA